VIAHFARRGTNSEHVVLEQKVNKKLRRPEQNENKTGTGRETGTKGEQKMRRLEQNKNKR